MEHYKHASERCLSLFRVALEVQLAKVTDNLGHAERQKAQLLIIEYQSQQILLHRMINEVNWFITERCRNDNP